MQSVIESHIGWLADTARMAALRRGIAATVHDGDVVLDVGSGTGVLAFMACDAGASRVYAVERGPIIGLARKLARINGYAERVTLIRGDLRTVTLPGPVDAVVSDLIGEFAFETGFFELMDHAGRWLRPGGRILPASVTLIVAALEQPRFREQFSFLAGRPAGYDMDPLLEHARNTAFHGFPSPEAVIAQPVEIAHIALPTATAPALDARVTTTAVRDGAIDAVAGWFDATLAPDVRMTNAPAASQRLDRRVLVLPVSPPIAVNTGDILDVRLRLLTHDSIITWDIRRMRAGDDPHAYSGATLRGALLAREDLTRFERR